MKKAASSQRKRTRIKPIPSLTTLAAIVEDADRIGSRTDQLPVEYLCLERHPLETFDPVWTYAPRRSRQPEDIMQEALNHLEQRKDEFDRSESLKAANRRMTKIKKQLAKAAACLKGLEELRCTSSEPGQPLRFVDRPLLTYIDENHPEDDDLAELHAMVIFEYFEAGARTDEQLNSRIPRDVICEEFIDLDLPGLIALGTRLELLSGLFAVASKNISDPGRTEKNTVGTHYHGRYIHNVVHTLWHVFRLTGRYPSVTGDGKFLEAVNLFFDAEEGNRTTIQDYWTRRQRQKSLQRALRRQFDREVYPDTASWPAEVRGFADRRLAAAGSSRAEQKAAQREIKDDLFKLWMLVNIKHFIKATEVDYLWGDAEPPGLQAWCDSNFFFGTGWPVKARRKAQGD